jgi:YgiT-type zinc finger domain-containing protein
MSDETRVRLVPCPRCGHGMRPGLTKTVIWVEERLYVVEDIPAQVCDECVEQFYDDETTDALRRMTEDRFPADEVKREIVVPVLSLEKRLRRFESGAEEQSAPVPAEA